MKIFPNNTYLIYNNNNVISPITPFVQPARFKESSALFESSLIRNDDDGKEFEKFINYIEHAGTSRHRIKQRNKRRFLLPISTYGFKNSRSKIHLKKHSNIQLRRCACTLRIQDSIFKHHQRRLLQTKRPLTTHTSNVDPSKESIDKYIHQNIQSQNSSKYSRSSNQWNMLDLPSLDLQTQQLNQYGLLYNQANVKPKTSNILNRSKLTYYNSYNINSQFSILTEQNGLIYNNNKPLPPIGKTHYVSLEPPNLAAKQNLNLLPTYLLDKAKEISDYDQDETGLLKRVKTYHRFIDLKQPMHDNGDMKNKKNARLHKLSLYKPTKQLTNNCHSKIQESTILGSPQSIFDRETIGDWNRNTCVYLVTQYENSALSKPTPQGNSNQHHNHIEYNHNTIEEQPGNINLPTSTPMVLTKDAVVSTDLEDVKTSEKAVGDSSIFSSEDITEGYSEDGCQASSFKQQVEHLSRHHNKSFKAQNNCGYMKDNKTNTKNDATQYATGQLTSGICPEELRAGIYKKRRKLGGDNKKKVLKWESDIDTQTNSLSLEEIFDLKNKNSVNAVVTRIIQNKVKNIEKLLSDIDRKEKNDGRFQCKSIKKCNRPSQKEPTKNENSYLPSSLFCPKDKLNKTPCKSYEAYYNMPANKSGQEQKKDLHADLMDDKAKICQRVCEEEFLAKLQNRLNEVGNSYTNGSDTETTNEEVETPANCLRNMLEILKAQDESETETNETDDNVDTCCQHACRRRLLEKMQDKIDELKQTNIKLEISEIFEEEATTSGDDMKSKQELEMQDDDAGTVIYENNNKEEQREETTPSDGKMQDVVVYEDNGKDDQRDEVTLNDGVESEQKLEMQDAVVHEDKAENDQRDEATLSDGVESEQNLEMQDDQSDETLSDIIEDQPTMDERSNKPCQQIMDELQATLQGVEHSDSEINVLKTFEKEIQETTKEVIIESISEMDLKIRMLCQETCKQELLLKLQNRIAALEKLHKKSSISETLKVTFSDDLGGERKKSIEEKDEGVQDTVELKTEEPTSSETLKKESSPCRLLQQEESSMVLSRTFFSSSSDKKDKKRRSSQLSCSSKCSKEYFKELERKISALEKLVYKSNSLKANEKVTSSSISFKSSSKKSKKASTDQLNMSTEGSSKTSVISLAKDSSESKTVLSENEDKIFTNAQHTSLPKEKPTKALKPKGRSSSYLFKRKPTSTSKSDIKSNNLNSTSTTNIEGEQAKLSKADVRSKTTSKEGEDKKSTKKSRSSLFKGKPTSSSKSNVESGNLKSTSKTSSKEATEENSFSLPEHKPINTSESNVNANNLESTPEVSLKEDKDKQPNKKKSISSSSLLNSKPTDTSNSKNIKSTSKTTLQEEEVKKVPAKKDKSLSSSSLLNSKPTDTSNSQNIKSTSKTGLQEEEVKNVPIKKDKSLSSSSLLNSKPTDTSNSQNIKSTSKTSLQEEEVKNVPIKKDKSLLSSSLLNSKPTDTSNSQNIKSTSKTGLQEEVKNVPAKKSSLSCASLFRTKSTDKSKTNVTKKNIKSTSKTSLQEEKVKKVPTKKDKSLSSSSLFNSKPTDTSNSHNIKSTSKTGLQEVKKVPAKKSSLSCASLFRTKSTDTSKTNVTSKNIKSTSKTSLKEEKVEQPSTKSGSSCSSLFRSKPSSSRKSTVTSQTEPISFPKDFDPTEASKPKQSSIKEDNEQPNRKSSRFSFLSCEPSDAKREKVMRKVDKADPMMPKGSFYLRPTGQRKGSQSRKTSATQQIYPSQHEMIASTKSLKKDEAVSSSDIKHDHKCARKDTLHSLQIQVDELQKTVLEAVNEANKSKSVISLYKSEGSNHNLSKKNSVITDYNSTSDLLSEPTKKDASAETVHFSVPLIKDTQQATKATSISKNKAVQISETSLLPKSSISIIPKKSRERGPILCMSRHCQCKYHKSERPATANYFTCSYATLQKKKLTTEVCPRNCQTMFSRLRNKCCSRQSLGLLFAKLKAKSSLSIGKLKSSNKCECCCIKTQSLTPVKQTTFQDEVKTDYDVSKSRTDEFPLKDSVTSESIYYALQHRAQFQELPSVRNSIPQRVSFKSVRYCESDRCPLSEISKSKSHSSVLSDEDSSKSNSNIQLWDTSSTSHSLAMEKIETGQSDESITSEDYSDVQLWKIRTEPQPIPSKKAKNKSYGNEQLSRSNSLFGYGQPTKLLHNDKQPVLEEPSDVNTDIEQSSALDKLLWHLLSRKEQTQQDKISKSADYKLEYQDAYDNTKMYKTNIPKNSFLRTQKENRKSPTQKMLSEHKDSGQHDNRLPCSRACINLLPKEMSLKVKNDEQVSPKYKKVENMFSSNENAHGTIVRPLLLIPITDTTVMQANDESLSLQMHPKIEINSQDHENAANLNLVWQSLFPTSYMRNGSYKSECYESNYSNYTDEALSQVTVQQSQILSKEKSKKRTQHCTKNDFSKLRNNEAMLNHHFSEMEKQASQSEINLKIEKRIKLSSKSPTLQKKLPKSKNIDLRNNQPLQAEKVEELLFPSKNHNYASIETTRATQIVTPVILEDKNFTINLPFKRNLLSQSIYQVTNKADKLIITNQSIPNRTEANTLLPKVKNESPRRNDKKQLLRGESPQYITPVNSEHAIENNISAKPRSKKRPKQSDITRQHHRYTNSTAQDEENDFKFFIHQTNKKARYANLNDKNELLHTIKSKCNITKETFELQNLNSASKWKEYPTDLKIPKFKSFEETQSRIPSSLNITKPSKCHSKQSIRTSWKHPTSENTPSSSILCERKNSRSHGKGPLSQFSKHIAEKFKGYCKKRSEHTSDKSNLEAIKVLEQKVDTIIKNTSQMPLKSSEIKKLESKIHILEKKALKSNAATAIKDLQEKTDALEKMCTTDTYNLATVQEIQKKIQDFEKACPRDYYDAVAVKKLNNKIDTLEGMLTQQNLRFSANQPDKGCDYDSYQDRTKKLKPDQKSYTNLFYVFKSKFGLRRNEKRKEEMPASFTNTSNISNVYSKLVNRHKERKLVKEISNELAIQRNELRELKSLLKHRLHCINRNSRSRSNDHFYENILMQSLINKKFSTDQKYSNSSFVPEKLSGVSLDFLKREKYSPIDINYYTSFDWAHLGSKDSLLPPEIRCYSCPTTCLLNDVGTQVEQYSKSEVIPRPCLEVLLKKKTKKRKTHRRNCFLLLSKLCLCY